MLLVFPESKTAKGGNEEDFQPCKLSFSFSLPLHVYVYVCIPYVFEFIALLLLSVQFFFFKDELFIFLPRGVSRK